MNTPIEITIFNKMYFIQVRYLLLVLVGVGGFIRFHELTYSGLWLDEIYSMIGSDPNTTLSDVYSYSIRDQPPVFFILLHGWLKIFGYTDLVGRAITCVYGLLGIIAIFFLGKEVKNEKLGLFAAFITSINWFHVYISKEIRFYPLVFLLTALSYLFYLRSIKKSGIGDFLLYTIFTALLLNTHYYGMVVFVSQFIILFFVILFFKSNLKFIIGAILAGGLAGLSFWHWLVVIQSDLQINAFHVDPVDIYFPFQYAWEYIKDPVAFALFMFCILFAIIRLYHIIFEKKIQVQHVVIFGWIFLGTMIPLIYSFVKMPLLTSKYSTIIVPAFFLVIAYGFTLYTNGKVKFYCILLIMVSGFIMLFRARPPYKPRRSEDWREVAINFTKHNSDKQIVFSLSAWFHQYYFKKYKLNLPMDQTKCDFDSIVGGTNQLWLLVNKQYTGGSVNDEFLPTQKNLIRSEFELRDSIMFKQTKALRYTRKNSIQSGTL